MLFLWAVLAGAVASDGPLWSAALVHQPGAGMPPAVADRVHAELRATLDRVGTLRVQGAGDTLMGRDQAREAGWRCDGAPACLAQLGRALAVDLLVEATISGTAVTPRLLVRVIDVAQATERGRVERELPSDLERWPPVLRAVVEELPVWGAGIRFHFARPVAEVTVDERSFVRPGMELVVAGLPAGGHKVRVVMEDLSEADTTVQLPSDGVASVWVTTTAKDVDLVVVPPAPRVSTEPPPPPAPPSRAPQLVGTALSVGGLVGLALATLGVAVGGIASLVGMVLLASLPREPTRGRVMAREGQD
ncbi:MAG: hypothetical protein AB2A00_31430, partial [Myxococcota bacterium]